MNARRCMVLLLFIVCVSMFESPLLAQSNSKNDGDVAGKVAAAAKRLQQQQKYDLRYAFKKGETIRWRVVHEASTEMQQAGFTGESASKMDSIKVWTVSNVDSKGNMTFVHSLELVKAWQKIDEEEPETFDSTDPDADVPETYQSTAERIGKPLAVFTIAPNGEIIDRKSNLEQKSFGAGEVTVPLPSEAIAVGHRWAVPTMFSASDVDGRRRKFKARIVYELAKVSGFQAYIKFRTEMLTPSISEKVKSQLMQKATDGYVVFDMKLGRPIKKQVEWDEKAQGFDGPDTSLTYIARMEETLVTDGQPVQTRSDADRKSSSAQRERIRTRESDAISRR